MWGKEAREGFLRGKDVTKEVGATEAACGCLVSPTRGKSWQRLAGRMEAKVNLENAREVWVSSAQDRHALEAGVRTTEELALATSKSTALSQWEMISHSKASV